MSCLTVFSETSVLETAPGLGVLSVGRVGFLSGTGASESRSSGSVFSSCVTGDHLDFWLRISSCGSCGLLDRSGRKSLVFKSLFTLLSEVVSDLNPGDLTDTGLGLGTGFGFSNADSVFGLSVSRLAFFIGVSFGDDWISELAPSFVPASWMLAVVLCKGTPEDGKRGGLLGA